MRKIIVIALFSFFLSCGTYDGGEADYLEVIDESDTTIAESGPLSRSYIYHDEDITDPDDIIHVFRFQDVFTDEMNDKISRLDDPTDIERLEELSDFIPGEFVFSFEKSFYLIVPVELPHSGYRTEFWDIVKKDKEILMRVTIDYDPLLAEEVIHSFMYEYHIFEVAREKKIS